MSYELVIYIKDSTVKNGAVITTQQAPPAQAIKKALKALKSLGYPLRNTVTELIRELLFIKFELDFKDNGKNGKAELRSTDTRGSATSLGTNQT